MLSDAEVKLLESDCSKWPLLRAAQENLRRCSSCGHSRVNIHTMLRLALNKYKSDKEFIAHCRKLFALPCAIAGVLLN